MIEGKKIYSNAGIYESINILKKKIKYNSYKNEITWIEN